MHAGRSARSTLGVALPQQSKDRSLLCAGGQPWPGKTAPPLDSALCYVSLVKSSFPPSLPGEAHRGCSAWPPHPPSPPRQAPPPLGPFDGGPARASAPRLPWSRSPGSRLHQAGRGNQGRLAGQPHAGGGGTPQQKGPGMLQRSPAWGSWRGRRVQPSTADGVQQAGQARISGVRLGRQGLFPAASVSVQPGAAQNSPMGTIRLMPSLRSCAGAGGTAAGGTARCTHSSPSHIRPQALFLPRAAGLAQRKEPAQRRASRWGGPVASGRGASHAGGGGGCGGVEAARLSTAPTMAAEKVLQPEHRAAEGQHNRCSQREL